MKQAAATLLGLSLLRVGRALYIIHANERKISIHRRRSTGPAPHAATDDSSASSFASLLLSHPGDDEIRGDHYGASNNSTIPTPEDAASACGVKPSVRASKETWRRVWRLHGAALPALHAFDSFRPRDSSLSLRCLWLKALSGNDASSPVYDAGLSYDLLPRGFRLLVGRQLGRFYPRLHHANIEMRTAFLDKAVTNFVASVREKEENTGDETKRIRLVSIGAGYDVRSVKFIERQLIDEAIELDLPEVVEAKKLLLGPQRLLRRRPWLSERSMPRLIAVDLNKVNDVKKTLEEVVTQGRAETWKRWHTVFVFEAVMIYLDDGVPSKLLGICSGVLNERKLEGSICFADRLENVPGGDEDLGRAELSRNGWDMIDWSPKPGLARHMGSARLLRCDEEH